MEIIKIILRTSIVVLAVLILILLGYKRHAEHSKNMISIDYGRVSDFSLTDQTGATITLNSLKGNVWLANFIFTRCQGPCPLIAYKTSQLQNEFVNESNLKFVSISVDPDFDTPAVLAKYASSYGADNDRWHFLTGEKKKLYALIHDGFKLAAEGEAGKSGSAGDFVHSTFFVLVDKDGHIRGYYNSTDQVSFDKLRFDLKKWL